MPLLTAFFFWDSWIAYIFSSWHEAELLRGIVNHSNGKSLVDNDRNTKDNRLSGTNRYDVLENYDEVENAEIGTKSMT